MLKRTRKKIRVVWIVISLLAVLGMLIFTIIPLLQTL